MSKIKIIHTADLHLDSPMKSLALKNPNLREKIQIASRTAFRKITQTCIDKSVSALLISGDLFDGIERSAKTAAFLLSEFDKLSQTNIQVFYIKGNHDAENPNSASIKFPNNVHVFDGRGGNKQLLDYNIFIHGVSFLDKKAPKSLLSKFGAPIPNAINIAMLHTSLAGTEGHDVYAPCSLAELCGMGFDYWALGHIHKRAIHSKSPLIVMPGIPQGRDIGELGSKSATMLEINDGDISISEIDTSTIEFKKIQINIEGIDDEENLRSEIHVQLNEVSKSIYSEAGILRVELIGTTNLYWAILRNKEIWQEIIEKSAEMLGNIWIEKVKYEIKSSFSNLENSNSALDEIENIIENLHSDLGIQELITEKFNMVYREFPTLKKTKLFTNEETETDLKKLLLKDGVSEILASMRGDG